ncbi:unnamed protein product [Cyprideis torosa]|uniref:Uncharacterized protein n=1 Tax=Cyprideis torosa TaxID=163714 RepID=A0A7R8W549_9CRUS|nr:unnamed protein product [Cyprideis torosa]CAG0883890.1 unnamed protein product [Cyprideis torosa]
MTRGSRWIEETFYKRECCQIVHCTKEKTRCGCGEHVSLHAPVGSPQPVGEARWNPMRHTTRSPTDAYGSIDFQAGAHPSKAKYIRLSYDTRPETVLTLLTQEWQLEAPKLLVSVHGGKQNFLLQPQLKKAFTEGLLRVAKSTGAWILSNGMDTGMLGWEGGWKDGKAEGVTHHVGDVLISERSPCLRPGAGRVVSIGVAPWGVIESRECLISKMKDIPYQAISSPKSKFCVLNKWHSYFLLVDNGTVGKHGAEIPFRKRLERHISRMPLTASTTSIPVVCLVLEGGLNTIRTVFEYVTDTPPVPVVIVDGSGRASDLLAFMLRSASDLLAFMLRSASDLLAFMLRSASDLLAFMLRYETTPLSPLPDAVQEQLLATIQRTFDIAEEQSQLILDELLECVYRKDMITVYELDGKSTLDMALLTTLLKQKCLSVQDQLSLTIVWNRVDIAKDKIFVYGQEWPPGSLSSSMMDALMLDRLDFVKLLLENGVTMDKFLTIPRLEELYNVAVGPTNTLRYLVADVRPTLPSNPRYTLMDIGLVIEKLMGGAFRSNYCRRRFRLVYAAVMNRAERNLFGTLAPVASVLRFANLATKPKPQMGAKGEDLKDRFFDYPFNELMLWAILTKRQQMALLMWSHGEEAVVKAIVASKLYRAMAHEAKDDDLEAEVYEELKQCAREFEVRALELLDYCYRQDDELAQQLLTYELANWSRMTSLSLAVTANHRALLAHPCAQILLADLWLGGLRMRKSTNLKVLLGIFCPPAILILMDFKTEEELHWQPQTEEEVESSELPSCETSDGTRHRRPSTSSSSTDDSLPGRRSLASASSGFTFSRATSQQPSNGLLMDPEAGNDGRHLLHASFRRRKHRRSSGSSGRSRERDHPKVTFSLPRNSGPPQTPSPQQLTNRKKIYEFYNAPITKFWIHSCFLRVIGMDLNEGELEVGKEKCIPPTYCSPPGRQTEFEEMSPVASSAFRKKYQLPREKPEKGEDPFGDVCDFGGMMDLTDLVESLLVAMPCLNICWEKGSEMKWTSPACARGVLVAFGLMNMVLCVTCWISFATTFSHVSYEGTFYHKVLAMSTLVAFFHFLTSALLTYMGIVLYGFLPAFPFIFTSLWFLLMATLGVAAWTSQSSGTLFISDIIAFINVVLVQIWTLCYMFCCFFYEVRYSGWRDLDPVLGMITMDSLDRINIDPDQILEALDTSEKKKQGQPPRTFLA